jgi:hypothetical protein
MNTERIHNDDHYLNYHADCERCKVDELARFRLFRMLEVPLNPLEITMHYRRHLRFLGRIAAIKWDPESERWTRLLTMEEFEETMKRWRGEA